MYHRESSNKQSVVLILLTINIVIFVFQLFFLSYFNLHIERFFALNPLKIVEKYWLWQIVTYMFLHSPVNFFHILFNMYLLWMFGAPVEEAWGNKTFLKYYFFSGIGAGLSILLLNYFQAPFSYTIGASGAVFALLLAYGLVYPDHKILLFFVIPLKAKYLVVLYGVLELMLMFSSPGSNISHIGHLGGLFFGFLYFVFFKRIYLFPNKKVNEAFNLLRDINQKVEKIKDKAFENSRNEYIQKATIIQKKGSDQRTDSEKKFLQSLMESIDADQRIYMCESEDFSEKDSYCRQCELFNLCLYRKTTDVDIKYQ